MVYPTELVLPVTGQSELELGRDVLAHRTVSRRHVVIDGNRVRDLGSHNGTWVDGERTTGWTQLAHNSVLRLGDVLLVYEVGKPPLGIELETIPGRAVATAELRAKVVRAAIDPSPALLVGETGTGKEWIARELHRASSRTGPLVAVNCAALAAQLVESQLFGHVRGSFTGAKTDQDGFFRAADGGTLFLDEIGELPIDLQPKLLRALQENEIQPVGSTRPQRVDVRVVAATNRELTDSIEAGTFRRDLYARLALWEIRVPALRDRRADILGWLARLHHLWAARRGAFARLDLDADAAEALLLAAHTENLRGLDRLVHELSDRPAITLADLPGWLRTKAVKSKGRTIPSREEIVAAYEQLAGSVHALARHFGRDRRQIYRWLDAYGLRERR